MRWLYVLIGVIALVLFTRWLCRCRHAHHYRDRDRVGDLWLVCDRCGDRVPLAVSDAKLFAKTQKKLRKSARTPLTTKRPAEIVPMRRIQ